LRCSEVPTAILSTVGLGSCLGITCYDSTRKLGALLHAMLPDSRKHAAVNAPAAMYLDLGLSAMLDAISQLGADPRHLAWKVFGGAQIPHCSDYFNLGRQNVEMMRSLASQHGLTVTTWAVGEQCNRSIELYLADGRVRVRMPAKPEVWK
jgi:chemotaxis protein CheD